MVPTRLAWRMHRILNSTSLGAYMPEHMHTNDSGSSRLTAGYLRLLRLLLVAVLVLIAVVRVRLADLPLERDEGEYAYAGQLILEGVPPYKLAYNMKFPGTYVAYALIMLVFGQTPTGIHLGVTLVTTVTALLLWRLGRNMLDEVCGVVAATTYAALAASPALLGLAGHATHFAALFVTAGLYMLWPAQRQLTWRRVAAAGLMFGLAILMKQHAAIFCVWGAFFVWSVCRHWGIPRSNHVRFLVAFSAGALVPFLVTCALLWYAGVMDRFMFWTISYAAEYTRIVPLHKAPHLFFESLKKITERDQLLWLIGLTGLGGIFLQPKLHGKRLIFLGFCVAAFLTTVPGFYFRRHYFILMLPAVGLLAGCSVSAAREVLLRKCGMRLGMLPIIMYGAVLCSDFVQNSDIWFRATPVQASRKIYLGNPFVEAEVFARYIQTNSTPETRVAVLGSEPQIYFLAQRRSATGYIYTCPLMEPHRFADLMHQQMIQEIESAKPDFVLFVAIPLSWLARPGSSTRIIDWWANSYRTNFTLVGVAVMNPPQDTQYLWGNAAIEFGERTQWGLFLYRRKAN